MAQIEKPHRHFRMFKPYGYLSQFQSNARHERNKKFLGELHDFPEGTMAIGRLDKNSEGLLLLTTDGKVSNEICSSSYEKEYYVQVDGLLTRQSFSDLKRGITIVSKGKSFTSSVISVKPLSKAPNFPKRGKSIRDARHGPTSWISITINEGKFHQVRKMTAAVGLPTLRLVRVRVGSILLDRLSYGEVEELESVV